MLYVRRSEERGQADHGWLKSYHSFSFADYYDPDFMGFSVLRVINEDRIRGGTGFPTHAHRDMEIISYVIEGALKHKDTLGNETIIQPGELQRMTAGTGVQHSEFNGSQTDEGHFLQIWILPERNGLEPGYEQKSFLHKFESRNLALIASHDGVDGTVSVHQDMRIYAGRFKPGDKHELTLTKGRHAWVQVIKGFVDVNDQRLGAGDGLAAKDETLLMLSAADAAEFLIFDLP